MRRLHCSLKELFQEGIAGLGMASPSREAEEMDAQRSREHRAWGYGGAGGSADFSSLRLVPPAQQSQVQCHPPLLTQRGHSTGHGKPRAPSQGEHGLVKEPDFAAP